MSRASLERALTPGERTLLDASTLLAYLDPTEHVSPAAIYVIDTLVWQGRNPAIVSPVTAMEILVRPLRRGVGEPYRHVMDFLTRFPNLIVVHMDLAVAQEAASVRAAHNLPTPDALVVATGLVHQVAHLVTNDQEWQSKLRPIANRIKVCYLNDHLPFP